MEAWSAPHVPTLSPAAGQVLVHDTALAELLPIAPESGEARMYVCGITPYDATHLGHANTYVAFDLLHRVLLDAGLRVCYTQNVTDIDDPLLERAEATGVDWRDLAQGQVNLFAADMTALRVLPPRDYVGAVEAIPVVVDLIESLKLTGAIYQVDDPQYPDWYFEVRRAPGFGRLSKLTDDEAVAVFAERGGDPERPGKRDPLDCLVWRLERPGEPAWESRLGRGRPGWHIECTAIALQHLGADFDIQGGGSDLIFPHHEMCAAEGAMATRQPFAKVYAHAGMVGLDGEKMSKSKGNLVLVSKLRGDGVDPMAIRLGLLARHYRSDWEWTDQALTGAIGRLDSWRAAVGRGAAAPAGPVIAALRDALRTDLDAPAALAVVDGWAATDGDDPAAPAALAEAIDALLGVALAG
ncbi:cysteine--1-D-myo-inosityl 2-amino-2-deoxy-alpha-D-glucopyranoside ligase [Micropruina sonneratiae]|uniref:cysteine--1-D-myo-inosityl 2-amino-2-deoxy-alpha-D-glucopyranoside ligase n=1 Tax=Micropruina sonneratiae TaxID=2986940 RepID=UPI0022280D1B|nr:cysteine--1-D-myo-inosityl 2-amino-2-deoxy-alpha-D-glucopyranoside ligase [Micropruina sp. KQZ13P-5]MCW3159616.1 cysteine--1-D-myo-inosityl 2-amino-2-deoxy-alpha-D-glucopyranoside ligase [Micropruina sp. KQZ13P-5]